MYSVLLTTVVAFALSLLLTPLVRNLFLRWQIVDQPDGVRKLHARAVPRVGGIPIAVAYLAAYAVLLLSPLRGANWLEQELPFVWLLMPAAGVAFLTGIADDLRGLRPSLKITGQLAAALLAYWGGVRIASIAGIGVPEWASLPLTLIWLVGCANAFNLIDGLDGLATGVGLLATLTIFGAALLQNNTPLALATVPLAGCLLGFLRYNFNPASIFLGDSGSLLVGFLLGCYGVIWSQKSATLLGMTAPLMALAIPLMDTALAILRRFLRGRPIFHADRGHVHHRLLDRGLSPRRVALLLYGAGGLAAALSLLTSVAYSQYAGLGVIVFLAAAWLGIQKLGFEEFGVAGRVVFGGELQNMVDFRISLRNLEGAIAGAANTDDCWAAIRSGCRACGVEPVSLRLASRSYSNEDQEARQPSWYLYVPVSESDFVLLARNPQPPANTAVMGPLADVLRSSLRSRLANLAPGPTPDEEVNATKSLWRLANAIQGYESGFDQNKPARPRAGKAV